VCLIALVVGLVFAVQELWLVLLFSGLVIFVLVIGLYVVSHKANRHQVITFDNDNVRIDKRCVSVRSEMGFNTSRVRLHYQVTGKISSGRKLELECYSSRVEVSEFLNNFQKDALAFQLKGCIIRAGFHRRLAVKAQGHSFSFKDRHL
jgi:uncharacterized membrane protein